MNHESFSLTTFLSLGESTDIVLRAGFVSQPPSASPSLLDEVDTKYAIVDLARWHANNVTHTFACIMQYPLCALEAAVPR